MTSPAPLCFFEPEPDGARWRLALYAHADALEPLRDSVVGSYDEAVAAWEAMRARGEVASGPGEAA
jgi:hypothetical protein